jgi:hypothetical protein
LNRRDIDHNPPIGAESLYASSSVLSAPSMLPSVPAAVAGLTYDQRGGSGTGLGMHSTSSRYGYDSYSVWYAFVSNIWQDFFIHCEVRHFSSSLCLGEMLMTIKYYYIWSCLLLVNVTLHVILIVWNILCPMLCSLILFFGTNYNYRQFLWGAANNFICFIIWNMDKDVFTAVQ